jgi:diadenosine tetraphosphate (Ap4A) HIT family hydrolase
LLAGGVGECMAKDCIFCRIADGTMKSYRFYEDKDYIAVLDIFPNIKGQAVVISRRHRDSYAFKLNDEELSGLVIATKRVARILERKLRVGRVHMVLEGTGVNHLHAKLYPAVGAGKAFEQAEAVKRVHFESYPGYVTTLMGPKADEKELEELQRIITG